jgi:hypothetical protein
MKLETFEKEKAISDTESKTEEIKVKREKKKDVLLSNMLVLLNY